MQTDTRRSWERKLSNCKGNRLAALWKFSKQNRNNCTLRICASYQTYPNSVCSNSGRLPTVMAIELTSLRSQSHWGWSQISTTVVTAAKSCQVVSWFSLDSLQRMCEAECEEAQSKFSLRLPQSFHTCQNQDKTNFPGVAPTDRQTLSDDKTQLCRPHESTPVSHSLGNHLFLRSDNFGGVTL